LSTLPSQRPTRHPPSFPTRRSSDLTPQEVSELLARITVVGKTEVNKVYDPACGSGSLLLKFAKVLGRENVRLGFFGQEVNLTTRSEEHTSELQSREKLVCRLLLEKK